MRWTEFEAILKNPFAISPVQTAALSSVLESYPYFIAARLFHLKGLKDMDSTAYNSALREAALYSTDRSFLFAYITRAEFLEDPHPPEARPPLSDLAAPLRFEPGERHFFDEWLRLGSVQRLGAASSTGLESPENPSDFQRKEPIIDAFLENQVRMGPPENPGDSTPPPSPPRPVQQADLMTETLARVYVEQKRYAQAIKAYNILRLKYPEKSGFFADRIKAIEKLMAQ